MPLPQTKLARERWQHRQAIAEGLRGRKRSASERKAISVGKRGAQLSLAHRRKVSQSLIGNQRAVGNKHTPAFKERQRKRGLANISRLLSFTGRPHTEATCKKISESNLLAWSKADRFERRKQQYAGRRHGVFASAKTPTPVYFSSSYERAALQKFEEDTEVLSVSRYSKPIAYRLAGVTRSYYPDFLTFTARGGTIVEVKPTNLRKLPINRTKERAAKLFAKQAGLGYCVLSERDLKLPD